MSSQDLLFHEDFNDALRHAVKALGGFEAVGHDLWPHKPRKAAGILLSDCMNPERAAKLDIEDLLGLLKLARIRGIHCAMFQLCDDVGYTQPQTAAPKSPGQILAERRVRLAAEMLELERESAALADSQTMAEIRALRK